MVGHAWSSPFRALPGVPTAQISLEDQRACPLEGTIYRELSDVSTATMELLAEAHPELLFYLMFWNQGLACGWK